MADRIYNFNLVVYTSLKHVESVLKAHGVLGWFILHDDAEDLKKEDGPDGVPHIHVVVKCSTAHSLSAVKGWFKYFKDGVEQNVRIEPCKSIRGSIRYLCHLDDIDKHLYSPDLVCMVGGNTADRIFVDSMSENGEDDRQQSVIMQYALYEISLREAIALAPEIFIHKYASIRNLIIDIRRELEEDKNYAG